MSEIIAFFLGASLSFPVGFLIFRRDMRKWRDRYREAMKWLDEAGNPQDPRKQRLEAAELSQGQLNKLPWFTRRDMEVARLKAGKPPRDNMHNLPHMAISAIEEAKLKYLK